MCVVVRQRTVDMYRRFLWDTCLGGDEVNWESGRKAERVEDPFPMPNGSIIQDLVLKNKNIQIQNSKLIIRFRVPDSRCQMPNFGESTESLDDGLR